MRPSIVLGPGERLRTLGALLGGLGFDLRRLHDWADLGSVAGGGVVVIVIDAGSTPQEDLGFLRRSLEKNPDARAVALGEDAGTRVARSLLALPRVRWLAWPPDLEAIISITAGLRTQVDEEGATHGAAMHAVRPATARADERDGDGDEADEDDELARIQSILEGDEDEFDEPESSSSARARSEAHTSASKSSPTKSSELRDRPAKSSDADPEPTYREIAAHSEREVAPQPDRERPTQSNRSFAQPPSSAAASQDALSEVQPSPRAAPARIPSAHETAPPWWRAQVADLADAVQRIELGAQAVRLEALDDEAAEQVDALDTEVARLVQFARTLGYVAAPPGRGEQVFDLAEMVQLFVKDLAGRPDAPRCLFRAPAYVWVRSDRVLLTQVFDALFWLAGACSRAGELVRAQVKGEGDRAEVRLEFPAGPLEAVEIERILEPYGVRRVLPDLGPNALSAARGILSGQGGRAELRRPSSGRLEWCVELPAVEAPPNGTSPVNAGGSGGRAQRGAASHEAD